MSTIQPRRSLLAALILFAAAGPAFAQAPSAEPPAAASPPAAAPTQPPAVKLPRVALTTAQGVIVIELAKDKAPVTAANFLRYVDQKRFDGATFYRASTPPGQVNENGMAEYGVLQGGVQNDPKRVLPPIAHESTAKTGVLHTDTTISMGRHAPGTATGDFFICVGDQSYLDADPKAKPPNPGFATFGHVVEGMDVVKKILAMPVSATAGVGVMKGEMLAQPVRIVSARRVG